MAGRAALRGGELGRTRQHKRLVGCLRALVLSILPDSPGAGPRAGARPASDPRRSVGSATRRSVRSATRSKRSATRLGRSAIRCSHPVPRAPADGSCRHPIGDVYAHHERSRCRRQRIPRAAIGWTNSRGEDRGGRRPTANIRGSDCGCQGPHARARVHRHAQPSRSRLARRPRATRLWSARASRRSSSDRTVRPRFR